MSFLVLIYLILVIVVFNILYTDGAYRKIYYGPCHRKIFLFTVTAILSTIIGPVWLVRGFMRGLIETLARKIERR